MDMKLVLVGLLGISVLGFHGTVSGQDNTCGASYVPVYWGCFDHGSYCSEPIPYFALHPPVYYSRRVARTYGYSPFAYPPGVWTSASEPADGAMMSESQPSRPEPLRIDNPFVEQSGAAVQLPPQRRRPQVVYPMAMAQQAD